MANYYIDYENVHNEGLKGVNKLQTGDSLSLFYSNKADTLKIDVVRQLMECPAAIEFVKIVNGVENALDFQLITALMCNYSTEENYYIISKDKGYDAAIEMAGKMHRDTVYRCKDIECAIKHQNDFSIDETEQEIIVELPLEPENKDLFIDTDEAAGDWDTEDTTDYDASHQSLLAEEQTDLEDNKDEIEAEKVIGTEAVAEMVTDIPITEENATEELAANQIVTDAIVEVPANNPEVPVESNVATDDEKARRAHQSMCTKLMNNIKNTYKIPVNYKEAGLIYMALEDSSGKMQFYHKLIQSMGKQKGGEFYQKIKVAYKSSMAIYKASLNNSGENAVDSNKNIDTAVEDIQEIPEDNLIQDIATSSDGEMVATEDSVPENQIAESEAAEEEPTKTEKTKKTYRRTYKGNNRRSYRRTGDRKNTPENNQINTVQN